MEQQQLFRGRDKRKKGWFWMDNDYLNGYARLFGAVGTAIYVSLCRHANNETQECFPAQSKIAEELGIVERTVRNYIGLFEKYHLITVEREYDPRTKKRLNNVYTLVDRECWDKPEAIVAFGKARGTKQHKPEATDDTNRRHQLPNKETNNNKTYNNKTKLATTGVVADTNSLIELFKTINPTYENIYKNKTERSALENLVKKFGREKVEATIKALPSIVNKKYAPTITKPTQLENKLAELIQFVNKEKSQDKKSKFVFL